MLELLKENRTLEKIEQLLSPLRLPRRLLIKTEGCDGVSNAYYDDGAVTVCYEYLDDLEECPREPTPAGVAPIDALIGPVMDVFLHEAGHAVFDMLQVPLFGREEDAADQFSVYIMLKMEKDEARRLIMGTPTSTRTMCSPRRCRCRCKIRRRAWHTVATFYNVLCMAYGADKELFGDFVSTGALPTGTRRELAKMNMPRSSLRSIG